MAKKRRKGRRARRSARGRWGGYALILAGVGILILAGVLGFRGSQASGSTWTGPIPIDYDPEEIVYQDPLYGVHEMGPSTTPIPFLPKDGPQPRVEVPVTFVDVGTVGATQVITQPFVIRNRGEAPLTVSRMYTTCGCTTAELSARVIPPGKAALLILRFDAGYHDVRGETVQRGVILEVNDPRSPQVEVWIRARVDRH